MDIDKSLFEDLSAHYMEVFHLPPLTSNIFTFLLFDFNLDGLTFEEIQQAACASKSSVSTSLNRLVQSNHVEIVTKLGERKRYYRVNKEIFMVQFQDTIHDLKKSKTLIDRFATYRKQVKTEDDLNTEKLKLHISLLENTIKLYEDTLEKLNQLSN